MGSGKWYSEASIIWNCSWCSFFNGHGPSGATPSSGGICASFVPVPITFAFSKLFALIALLLWFEPLCGPLVCMVVSFANNCTRLSASVDTSEVAVACKFADDKIELLSRPVARFTASWAIVLSVDIESVFANEFGTSCGCLRLPNADVICTQNPKFFEIPIDKNGKVAWMNEWLLTMELVGDTEFVIELFMVVDVVVKLLFVMEVKIVWLSSALDTLLPLVTDASSPWLWCCDVTTLLLVLVLMLLLLFWMLLCRTAPFSAFDCYKMRNNSRCYKQWWNEQTMWYAWRPKID